MRAVISATLMGGLFLALLMAHAAEQGVPKNVLEKQTKLIQAIVPSGWIVTSDGKNVTVERTQPADFFSTAPSAPQGPPKPYSQKPSLVLQVFNSLTAADLAGREKMNKDRAKALQMMESQMTNLGRTKPSDDDGGFVAKDAEQQERLDAYMAVRKAMPYLVIPDLFADDSSFAWDHAWFTPADSGVKAEMEQVRAKIAGLFSSKPLR